MGILCQICIAGAIVFGVGATILGNKHFPYATIWCGCVAAIFAVIACCAAIHMICADREAKSPILPPAVQSVPEVKDHAKTIPTGGPAITHYLPDPTPKYINDTIRATPPLRRAVVAKQFVGAPVSWEGRLASASASKTKPYVILDYRLGATDISNHFMFSFYAELPKYNFLLQLHEGALLHVEGVIKRSKREFH